MELTFGRACVGIVCALRTWSLPRTLGCRLLCLEPIALCDLATLTFRHYVPRHSLAYEAPY